MRAWQVTEYGEPVDVLHLVDAPRPDLGPGAKSVTSAPTSVITPATSEPGQKGRGGFT
jgi:hypothetical protein